MFMFYPFSNLLVLSQVGKNVSKYISVHLFLKMKWIFQVENIKDKILILGKLGPESPGLVLMLMRILPLAA